MKHRITVLDSVWCKINGDTARLLNNHLSFIRKKWTGKKWGNKNQNFEYETVRMIESWGKDEYTFPTGLLNQAVKGVKDFGEEYEIIDNREIVEYDEPYLEGITFRPYQARLIDTGLKCGRGVLKAPTATGKSIIILGLISAFSQEKILFLCHTKDLVYQMKNHLEKNGFNNIGTWTGDSKKIERITVATIQSYTKIAKKYSNHWDVVIIDEGHHVSSISGQYAKALTLTAAPIKLAVTATMPYIEEAKIALEAYVGPIIAEYTVKEANEDGFLAIPKIKIAKVPIMPDNILFDKTSFMDEYGVIKKEPELYPLIYWNGIVKNVPRNLRVLQEVQGFLKEGKTVLINITRIDHGVELMRLIKDHYKFKATFVHGETQNRTDILKDFNAGKVKVVIATSVFNEGVDVPNLGSCINAAGGKSEIGTLQKIGRGLRKTKDKDIVSIVDFHDTCHPILENHFRLRHKMYVKNGWLSKKGE
jgi:superfamily II DNA or RNA helicase